MHRKLDKKRLKISEVELFTYTGVQHDFYIRCCLFRLTVTRMTGGVTSGAETRLSELIPCF
jgi:hypothetical protein